MREGKIRSPGGVSLGVLLNENMELLTWENRMIVYWYILCNMEFWVIIVERKMADCFV